MASNSEIEVQFEFQYMEGDGSNCDICGEQMFSGMYRLIAFLDGERQAGWQKWICTECRDGWEEV